MNVALKIAIIATSRKQRQVAAKVDLLLHERGHLTQDQVFTEGNLSQIVREKYQPAPAVMLAIADSVSKRVDEVFPDALSRVTKAAVPLTKTQAANAIKVLQALSGADGTTEQERHRYSVAVISLVQRFGDPSNVRR